MAAQQVHVSNSKAEAEEPSLNNNINNDDGNFTILPNFNLIDIIEDVESEDLTDQTFKNKARLDTQDSQSKEFSVFKEELLTSENMVLESTQWFKKVNIPVNKTEKINFVSNSDGNELFLNNSFSKSKILERNRNTLQGSTNDVDLIIEDLENNAIVTSNENNCGENHELHFDDLPDEIKIKIFSYFTKRELCSYVAPVCLSWFQIAKDPLFWTSIYKTDFEAVDSWLLIEVILSWCKQLSCLELDTRADVTLEGFEIIFKSCPLIKYLSLKLCRQVNDEVLMLISRHLKHLESIDLEGCISITDKSFYNFIGLPLKSFSLAYCNQISDEGAIFLVKNFTNLIKVNFDGIQWITEDFVEKLVEYHKCTLEEVFLDGENITDSSFILLSSCKNLRLLEVSFCNSLTWQSIQNLKGCTNLSHLKLRKGPNFTSQSIITFFKSMPETQALNFRFLNLAECTEMNDLCMLHLSQRCPNLEILDVSWCWEITDGGISFVLDQCHHLKELYLVGLHELYGEPFARISTSNPQLKYLDLSQCNKMDDDLLYNLVQKSQKLVIKNYYGETMEMNNYDYTETDSE